MDHHDDVVVEALREMLERDFVKRGIVSKDVQRKVCMKMLREEDVVSDAEHKYNLASLMSTGCMPQHVIATDITRVHHSSIFLTGDEEKALVRNNRDLRIVFDGGMTVSHAMGFAQRGIDTERCLRHLNGYDGALIDIGGNYAMHRRAGRVVHSCTKCVTLREVHRMTERMVNNELSKGPGDQMDFCRGGAENCDVQATQAMCIHAMPDIDVNMWPKIMDRHGLTHVVGVFHFDTMMYQLEAGKLPDCGMVYHHDGADVVFHFENDPSFDYRHNWENLKKYAVPWALASTESEYTYVYEIIHSAGGVVTAEINRVMTAGLGRQIDMPLYAHIANEEWVVVESCVRNKEEGYSDMSHAAYERVKVQLPREMYEFMSMYGLSGDSVGEPMNKMAFMKMAMTYNSTRSFGEVCLTGKTRVSEFDMEALVDCMWHYVCWLRANNDQRVKAMNKALVAGQAIPNIPTIQALTLVPITIALAPLAKVGDLFGHYTKAFADAWRALISDRLRVPRMSDKPCYVKLRSIGFGQRKGFFHGAPLVTRRLVKPVVPLSEDEMVEHFLSSVDENESLSDDTVSSCDGGSSDTSEGSSETSVSSVEPEPLKVVSDVVAPVSSYNDDVINGDVRAREAARFTEYDELYSRRSPAPSIVGVTDNTGELYKDARSMLLEAALYNYDVGEGVIDRLRKMARDVAPGGHVNKLRVENENAGSDSGIVFFQVHADSSSPGLQEYGLCINPFNGRVHRVGRSADGKSATVTGCASSMVMTAEMCRVFNSYELASSVLRVLDTAKIPNATIELVSGVPGCGKTTEIVNEFTLEDAIITTVKHSREDTLAKLKKKFGLDCDIQVLNKRCRTNHSAAMHRFGTYGGVRTLFCDEGLMEFPGIMLSVIMKYQPKCVRIFGDPKQIGAIDRSPSMGVLMHPKFSLYSRITLRDTSKTMPGDVCVILTKLYGHMVYTTSPVRRSLMVRHVTDVAGPSYTQAVPGWEYMTVLTADRAKLLTGRGFVDGKKIEGDVKPDCARVFSVHEAQGQRFDRSSIVRMNPNTAAVLDSEQHVIVAISRHFYQCVYTTLVRDKLSALMETRVTDAELDAVMKPPEEWLVNKIQKLQGGN
uniref:Methyltransferase n=1 Tax=Erysiphe necator associated virga-like virus 14 TaxID=2744815 RepID=A0A8E4CZL5_9VIRU|nr:methyltransferase [Erysiphe necator associated virga-like virus 14]